MKDKPWRLQLCRRGIFPVMSEASVREGSSTSVIFSFSVCQVLSFISMLALFFGLFAACDALFALITRIVQKCAHTGEISFLHSNKHLHVGIFFHWATLLFLTPNSETTGWAASSPANQNDLLSAGFRASNWDVIVNLFLAVLYNTYVWQQLSNSFSKNTGIVFNMQTNIFSKSRIASWCSLREQTCGHPHIWVKVCANKCFHCRHTCRHECAAANHQSDCCFSGASLPGFHSFVFVGLCSLGSGVLVEVWSGFTPLNELTALRDKCWML